MSKLNKDDRNKEIVSLRDSGITCKEIADKLGISKQRVNEIYTREKYRGLIHKEKKTKWSSFYPEFIREYKEGSTIQEIANKYKCSTRTIFIALKKAGINRKRGKQLTFLND